MTRLDALHAMALRLSPEARSKVGLLTSALPASWRYGGADYRLWSSRLQASRSLEAGRDLVRLLLHEALSRAATTDFYAGRLPPPGRPLAARDPLEELAKLAVTTRQDLSSNAENMVIDASQVELVSTSGSSGAPLRFFLDKSRRQAEWAFVVSAWSPSGYRLGDVRAVLRGFPPIRGGAPFFYDHSFKELRLSPFDLTPRSMSAYSREISRRGIRFLHGYPSALSIFARFLQHEASQSKGWRHRVQGIFPVSEPLSPAQRSLFSAAFPSAAVLPFYGQSERVAFACWDPVSNVYRSVPPYGVVEILDETGQPVAPGKQGRVVATGFTQKFVALLRYDTGDEATLLQQPTAANGFACEFVDVSPRRLDGMLIGRDGRRVGTAALNLHSLEFASVRAYQFVQRRKGHVLLLVAPHSQSSSVDMEQVALQFAEKLGDAFQLQLEIVDRIPPAPSGKRPLVRSEIPDVELQREDW